MTNRKKIINQLLLNKKTLDNFLKNIPFCSLFKEELKYVYKVRNSTEELIQLIGDCYEKEKKNEQQKK